MSSLRKGVSSKVRSVVFGEDGNGQTKQIAHFVNEEHLYANPEKLASLQFLEKGRPPFNIQYMIQKGTKDPRNYLGQGYQETRQDPASLQLALNNYLSDPNNPAFRTIEQYATSLLNNGFRDAFDPGKRKRARNNQSNNGSGPPGTYVPQSEDATPGLPVMQLPFFTSEQQASLQMKKQQFADRAMENGGPTQVNNFSARPGWYTMDKRLGIPTASGGFNYPNYNPDTNQVEVRHYGKGFPTYMSNPNANQ
jgi:hypothetical protein